mmetsp:Transcript_27572/g.57705  ORF Transcript_27572/g.57705 Transcript_27572/m.57705 type:complete len:272 (+) Transcript_27572:52-867(+)
MMKQSILASWILIVALLGIWSPPLVVGFATVRPASSRETTTRSTTTTTTALFILSSRSQSRSAGNNSRGQDRSKRQERVGHLVRSELSRILHTGNIKGNDVEYLDDELRQRISVVSCDVSPDLRQARITVSIRDGSGASAMAALEDEDDDDEEEFDDDEEYEEEERALPSSSVMDKRRAYSWLVRNTKPLRHTLAQRMSHMKSCPNLTFNQVDVAAAVDVMYLIDKVSAGAKRDSLDVFDVGPRGVIEGIDFDENDEDGEWIEEDDEEDFF